MWSTGRSEAAPTPSPGCRCRSTFGHPRARRMRLRIDERARAAEADPARRGQPPAALAGRRSSATGSRRNWPIEPGRPLVPGATIPLEGARHPARWDGAAPRTPRLDGGCAACGGPRGALGRAHRALAARRGARRAGRARRAQLRLPGRSHDRAGQRRRCRHALGKLLGERARSATTGGWCSRRRKSAATSSRMKSRTSCTSIMAAASRRWKRELFGGESAPRGQSCAGSGRG